MDYTPFTAWLKEHAEELLQAAENELGGRELAKPHRLQLSDVLDAEEQQALHENLREIAKRVHR